jgi:7-cyano-7-deazaguanine synthase in queuosine biosynthesis
MLENIINDILLKHNRIGVLVSGGFDSALLLYMLYTYKTTNQITVFVIDRPNDSVKHSKRVINYIDKHFGITSDVQYVGTSKVHHSLHVRTGITDALKFPIDAVVLGTTANPSQLEKGPDRPISNNPQIIQPFITVTKDVLVGTAKKLNAFELLNVSWSCEHPGETPCGVCWHCKEKQWAISEQKV